MSELQKLETEFEAFLAKAETETELLIAKGMAALKNTISLLVSNPDVAEALKQGLPIAVSSVIGAAEGGGAGAIAGAVVQAGEDLLKNVEVPAGSALPAIINAEIAAAVAGPTAATPEVKNP